MHEKQVKRQWVKWDEISHEPIQWNKLTRDNRLIEVQYEDVNIDYKDEARKDLSEALGFVPDLRASMATEMYHRDALRRLYLGELSKENFDEQKKRRVQIIRNLILKEVPEQAHLV